MLTLASFLFVIAVLIFVHELGHFMAAKAVGIGVPRFSIGFGPKTPLAFKRGETEYVVSWIPFGGYVKMASKEEQGEIEALEGGQVETPFPPHKLFESKSLAARILVISAGVIMNAIFAWIVYSWLAFAYGRAEDPTVKIARVDAALLPESARDLAEIPFGAAVVRVNGEEVRSWNAIMEAVIQPGPEELRFEFAGDVEPITVAVPGLDVEARLKIARAFNPLWEARVGSLTVGYPAVEAGLELNDLITAIDSAPLRSWDDLTQIVETSAGKTLTLAIDRDGQALEIAIVPVETEVSDPVTGGTRKVGRIGIGPKVEMIKIRYAPAEALVEGFRETWRIGKVVLLTLKGMIVGQISFREIGGPVLIAEVSGQAAAAGFEYLLDLMALLSVNLAILNLLPIPVLDGGHLVFLFLEGLRGRPVSSDLRLRLTQAGFYFLIALMLFVVVNDLLR